MVERNIYWMHACNYIINSTGINSFTRSYLLKLHWLCIPRISYIMVSYYNIFIYVQQTYHHLEN